jgi:pimeloyl-ACP methyl ester carboxylesterase
LPVQSFRHSDSLNLVSAKMNADVRRTMNLYGIELELLEFGAGQPLLFLHGAGGVPQSAPFLDLLAEHFRVIVPSHPGFGDSDLPKDFDCVDDLAYLYLDLIDRLELSDLVLVGSSFGGWIAAEIAIRCCNNLSKLILVDPIGIKLGDRETRDIVDIFALTPEALRSLLYFNPPPPPNYTEMSDDELALIARNQASFALYVWEPYAHNPKLRSWLHRINVPTLLIWGENDGIVSTDYGAGYRDAIPGSRLEVIPNAAHLPQIERPETFVERVLAFVGGEA